MAALALVLAQLLGAYAHAGHDDTDRHAACAHFGHHAPAHSQHVQGQHVLGQHVLAQDVLAQTGGDSGAADKANQGGDGAPRSLPCDFFCHGGIAILPTAGFSSVDATPPYVCVSAIITDPAPLASLERPPRPSVRA